MKVKELIEILSKVDPDMEVVNKKYDEDLDINHYYRIYNSMLPKVESLYQVTLQDSEIGTIIRISDRKRKKSDSVISCEEQDYFVLR